MACPASWISMCTRRNGPRPRLRSMSLYICGSSSARSPWSRSSLIWNSRAACTATLWMLCSRAARRPQCIWEAHIWNRASSSRRFAPKRASAHLSAKQSWTTPPRTLNIIATPRLRRLWVTRRRLLRKSKPLAARAGRAFGQLSRRASFQVVPMKCCAALATLRLRRAPTCKPTATRANGSTMWCWSVLEKPTRMRFAISAW